jgi:hypothetical protein
MAVLPYLRDVLRIVVGYSWVYSVTIYKLIGAREAYFFSWVHLASEEASGSSLSTLQLLRSGAMWNLLRLQLNNSLL